jgi:hypothetical protein
VLTICPRDSGRGIALHVRLPVAAEVGDLAGREIDVVPDHAGAPGRGEELAIGCKRSVHRRVAQGVELGQVREQLPERLPLARCQAAEEVLVVPIVGRQGCRDLVEST